MLLLIAALLVVLWFVGFLAHIGGDFVHIILVVAAIIVIYNFVVGRRAV
ncbi:MAG TPA: lmo0937 family membrane protein [Candidatus Saccharimonadales bacterium]|nr:lmo0937 family membrane protein [Candidatus Saccharimonadales bacterium]